MGHEQKPEHVGLLALGQSHVKWKAQGRVWGRRGAC